MTDNLGPSGAQGWHRGDILRLLALATLCEGHGQITCPPARTNGTLGLAGSCEAYECFWFTQPTIIPGAPTLNRSEHRTFNIDVASGETDWSRRMPWRAPGAAPVLGSGCGVAGGSPLTNMSGNGGNPPPGIAQGADGLAALAPKPPTAWKRGAAVEVAWAMMANHGGGYSWRLCPNGPGATVDEACFQTHPLSFAGDRQWIRYGDVWQWGTSRRLPDLEIPLVRVTQGTTPPGSEWARNPIPACRFCDASEHAACAAADLSWDQQQHCSQACSGFNVTFGCPAGMTQFAEIGGGLSGFYPRAKCSSSSPNGLTGFGFSVVDKVLVPAELAPGPYLLSWRWDAEQSKQVWQNCADVYLE